MSDIGIFSGGIALPIGPDSRGGLALITGDAYIEQLIVTLAANSDSDNPFLDVGIAAETIFQNVSDDAWRGVVRRQIQDVFSDLERAQIAKLLSVTFAASEEDPAEFIAQVRYLSIETATESQVETVVRRA